MIRIGRENQCLPYAGFFVCFYASFITNLGRGDSTEGLAESGSEVPATARGVVFPQVAGGVTERNIVWSHVKGGGMRGATSR